MGTVAFANLRWLKQRNSPGRGNSARPIQELRARLAKENWHDKTPELWIEISEADTSISHSYRERKASRLFPTHKTHLDQLTR